MGRKEEYYYEIKNLINIIKENHRMKAIEKEKRRKSQGLNSRSDSDCEEEGMSYTRQVDREFIKYKNFYISKHKYDLIMNSGAANNPLKEKLIL